MAKLQTTTLPLFPILDRAAPVEPALSGIARLAAQGELAGEGYLIEFHGLKVRSVLNRTSSRRELGFAWSINPYRGCEFACRYCYARYTHEYMELRRPEDFERKIFIKRNAPWLLEQELRQVRSGEEIAIGTATDPYQPIERHAKVTETLLETLAGHRGLHLGLVTKSTLIERDIPLLTKIARNNTLVLHLTVHHSQRTAGAAARTPGAQAGSAAADRRPASPSRPDCGGFVLAGAARHHRYSQGARCHGGKGEGRGRQLFLRASLVPEALLQDNLPRFCPPALPAA